MMTPRIQRSSWSFPVLVLAGLALLVAGVGIWFLRPSPKHTARTQLHVPVNPPNLLDPVENRLTGEAFLRNQAYIIKDHFVLNAVLNDPQVAGLSVIEEQSDPLQWLRDEIRIDFPGSEFIQISMSGDRPHDLLVLVNAVRRSYLEKTTDKEIAERENQLRTLKEVRTDWEKRSQSSRKKLRMLQEQAGVIDANNMALLQKMALEEMEAARKELLRVRGEIRQLVVEIGLHPDWVDGIWPRYAAALSCLPGPALPVNVAFISLLRDEYLVARLRSRLVVSQARLDSDPIAAELLKKIGKLKADIITVKANSPSEEAFRKDSAALRSALELAQRELAQRRQELRNQLEEEARACASEPVNRARSPRERLAVARELERRLLEEIQRLDEMKVNKNKMAVDLVDIKDEVAKAEDILRRVNQKIDQMEMEQKAPPRVREFGEGEIIKPDDRESRLWTTASVSLAGLGVVLLAFAGIRFLAPSPPALLSQESETTSD